MSLRTRLVLLFTLAALAVGAAGGLLLARRLHLGLEADLDAVLAQHAVAVVEDPGSPDLSAAQGPVQILDAAGTVVAHAGGAGDRVPLLNAAQRARAGGGVFVVEGSVPIGGHEEAVRILGRPDGPGRLVVLAAARDPIDDVVARTAVELGLLGVPAIGLLAAGVWLVTGAALRPVERMRAQAAAATPTEPAVLTVPPGKDELARLAVTLNDLLSAQQAALRAEQSFLADAGHELRTPLAILAGELEYADRPNRTMAELRETVTIAREETTRLVRLAELLLVLARVDGASLHRTDTDLPALAERAVSAWAAVARARAVELVLTAGPEVSGWVDADRIRQVLDNLLANALRAAPAGTAVEISLSHRGSGVRLAVRDHGPGFPPDFLPYAFERFRRADPARARGGPAGPGEDAGSSGTGLGLAVVRRIAEAHGGTATAANAPDGGAALEILLPFRHSDRSQDDASRPVVPAPA
ncbi:MAG TPA: HAMP domain-containing sensor histidine kinase [Mycobacteriales bacterium]|nr:HAMP domain-containing sensor histidine kinase [Mycobacteriales bacterium]